MQKYIRALLKFIISFGLIRGLYLACRLQLGLVNKIFIPNIKSPIKLRKNTSDIPTFWQVFANKEYDIDYGNVNPKIIIDAGANIGLFSVLMKNKFPNSLIIAIEPNKDNFDLMLNNLNKYENIDYVNSGLFNKATKVKVFDKYKQGYWAMVTEESSEGELDTITIENIIEKYSIDFIDILKIDIEGSEKELFSDNYEKWLPKCKIIIIELHDRMKIGCASTFFRAISQCISNYDFQIIGENIIIKNLDII